MGKSASKPEAQPPLTDLDMLLETVVAYYESTRATVCLLYTSDAADE